MTDSVTAETKRKQSIHLRAHAWATKHQADAPSGWSKEERGTYWWGLYEGYKAGMATERRRK